MSAIPVAVRQRVKVRQEGRCFRCGRHHATNCHHRLLESRGGKHVGSNLILLCGSGTAGCHGFATEKVTAATELGLVVPSWLNPADVPLTGWFGTGVYVTDDWRIYDPRGDLVA